MSADSPSGVVGDGSPTGAAEILPALPRLPGEYDLSYRERQIITLGAGRPSEPPEFKWKRTRDEAGVCSCDGCWRAELHRRGRVKLAEARRG